MKEDTIGRVICSLGIVVGWGFIFGGLLQECDNFALKIFFIVFTLALCAFFMYNLWNDPTKKGKKGKDNNELH